jgi:CubicO group peptidase (beta-lactamase class C family)
MDPRYLKWRAYKNEPIMGLNSSMKRDINIPLLYEPGTSWSYGVSIDWVGILVARLNDTSLESYMETHIWSPLGIKNITFHQELKPDVQKNLTKLTVRTGIPKPHRGMPVKNDAAKVEWTDELLYQTPTEDEVGGGGAIGSAIEYMKILTSLLSPTSVLLKPSTIEEMFTPQFPALSSSLKDYERFLTFPVYIDAFASQPAGTKVNWGLGGMLVLNDFEYGKRKGTMSWSGLPNLLWTIDRESGLACMYASNIVPFGDFKSAKMQVLFEEEMYRRFGQVRGRL